MQSDIIKQFIYNLNSSLLQHRVVLEETSITTCWAQKTPNYISGYVSLMKAEPFQ